MGPLLVAIIEPVAFKRSVLWLACRGPLGATGVETSLLAG